MWERGRLQRPERWRSVKGPVGATSLSLDRLKWTWPSAFQFNDDNNMEIMLTTTSLALLKSMLNTAVRRRNPRRAAGKLADSSGFSGVKASIEVARRVADSKRGRLSRKESSSLRNEAVNAIWTKRRLEEAGAGDFLVRHVRPNLVLQKPLAVAARNRFASVTLQAEATKEGADLLWVMRAIIDGPSDHLPPPNAKDLAVNEEILDTEDWNSGTDCLCAFSDGSCTQELSR